MVCGGVVTSAILLLLTTDIKTSEYIKREMKQTVMNPERAIIGLMHLKKFSYQRETYT